MLWIKMTCVRCNSNGTMHVGIMHKGSGFAVSPTFQEGVSCNREEGQLKEGLAENEGLEPLRRVQHHRVFELLRIPPENIFELQRLQQSANKRKGKRLFCC